MRAVLLSLLAVLLPAPALAQAGALDPTFGGAGVARIDWPDGYVHVVDATRLPDGAYAVASSFSFGVARVTSDGRLDENFGTGGWASDTPREQREAGAMAVQTDGKILVGGWSTTYHAPSGTTRYYLTVVRYNTDGSLDTDFGTGGRAYASFPDYQYLVVQALAIGPTGRIAAGGYAYVGGQYQWMLAVFTSAGVLDTGFSGDGRYLADVGAPAGCTYYSSSHIQALAFRPDGRLLAGGYACTNLTHGTVGTDLVVAQFSTSGAITGGFGTNGFAAVEFNASQDGQGLSIQPDGKIIVGGHTYYDGNGDPVDTADFGVARFTAGGILDASFGTGGIATLDSGEGNSSEAVHRVGVDATGRVVVVGRGNDHLTVYPRWLAGRLTSTGEIDPAFGFDGILATDFAYADIRGLVIEPDGRIVAVGNVYDHFGTPQGIALVRYLETPAITSVTVRFRLNVSSLPHRLPTDTFGVRGSVAPLSWSDTVPLSDTDGDGIWEGEITFPASAAGDSLAWRFVAHRAGSTTPAVETAPASSGERALLLADDRTISGSFLGALHDAHANALAVDLDGLPYHGFQDYWTAQQGYVSPTPEANEVPVACSGEAVGSVWYRVAGGAAARTLVAEVQSYDGEAVAVEVFLPGERSVPPPACDAWEPGGGRSGGLASALGRPVAPAPEMRPLPPSVEARTAPVPPAVPPSPADARSRADVAPVVAWGPQPVPTPTREEVARAVALGGGSAYEARVVRELPAGQTAWVRVSGRAYLTLGTPPANDQQAQASVARGVAYQQTVDWTGFATVERPRFDPPASCAPGSWQPNPGRTLWWRYTAPRPGTIDVRAYLYSSTSQVVLTAYSVGPDGAVTETACDRSTANEPNPEFDDLAITEGQTVLFRVSDSNDYAVSYVFSLDGLEPANDDLAAAPYLSVGSSVAADTRGAASEAGEVSGDCDDTEASLWWYVYARYDGRITVRATTTAGQPAPQISLWRDPASQQQHPLTRVVCGTTVAGGERVRTNGDAYALYYVRVSSAGGPVTVTVDEASLTAGGEASLAPGEAAAHAAHALVPGLAVTPNPARGAAAVALTLAAPEARVAVAVYDVLGREVARLHEGPADAGTLALPFDAAQLPSGAYVVRAVGAEVRFTERITVVR